ncbi:MAG: carbamoyltransferase HypF [Pseudomonadota bacterium]
MTQTNPRGLFPLSLPVLNSSTKHKQQGVEILVQGTVQGVGFRPFIYNLACRLGIYGTVTNTGNGVVITAIGSRDRLHRFIDAISSEAPPLSKISKVLTKDLSESCSIKSFSILPSKAGNSANTAIPPDVALCDDCLRELLDPTNRRFHYPFINCTNCGPRFTIVHTIPYDRPKTSMQVFALCSYCQKEYHDPTNRRFHAQPNACPTCGPSISLHSHSGEKITSANPIADTASLLHDGRIVALRGLGGFHLAVNGCSSSAVALLRERKGRPDKPLAIMVRDLAVAHSLCLVSSKEAMLLSSPAHPIVLLQKKPSGCLADNLAPAIDEIGVMLPYTPLHHLLFQMPDCPAALVMTSGNASGAPICTANDDALKRLGSIADYFLLHNREIVTRVDDSVVKMVDEQPLMLRRARGFVPSPLLINRQLPKILGCGAGMKNTFCLGREGSVFPSQHIGDLDNLASYDFYIESIDHLCRLQQFKPEAVACDLHPDYMSSRYAADLNLPLYPIQHHHAHAVAVMAEHDLDGPVLAVVFDGTGLGDDGTIWGGEILLTELTSYQRLGHLSHLHLPGGDAAATEPWRMALAALYATFGADAVVDHLPPALSQLKSGTISTILSMLAGGFNSPLTSSCGRLFDGVAALLGVRQKISYEGQAAMELEALARKGRSKSWRKYILPNSHSDLSAFLRLIEGKWEISCPEFVKLILAGIASGEPPAEIAWHFHSQLIDCITRLLDILTRQTGIRQIVLSGGCMQNSILLEGLLHTLKSVNLQVFTGNLLPVNDGAVSIGQTIIGGLRHVSRNSHEGNQRRG